MTTKLQRGGQLLLDNWRVSSFYVVLILVYLSQVLLVPADKKALAKYHVSESQIKLIALTVVIPYVIIWLITLVGYIRLKTYAGLIKKDADGNAFAAIAYGILWMGLWLPLSTIVSGFLSWYYQAHPGATAALVIINNYFNLLILVIAVWLVYRGTRKLLPLVRRSHFSSPQWMIMGYIAFTALYITLSLKDPARRHPTDDVSVASYYMSDWLLVTTLLVPRLMAWFLGLQAAQNISLYRRKVKGKLYKHALNRLAYGVAGVIGIVVLLRCLQSLATPLSDLGLGLLLGIIYLLLILIAICYGLIARGAKALQKLEEL